MRGVCLRQRDPKLALEKKLKMGHNCCPIKARFRAPQDKLICHAFVMAVAAC